MSTSPSISAWVSAGDDVLAGVGAALLDERVAVREQLGHRVLGVALLARELRVLAADHAVRPVEDELAVGLRHAHHLGDHLQRELGREVGDEVALAPLDDRVDDPRRGLVDVALEVADAARRERPAHEQPVPRVARRVHHQHQHVLLGEHLLFHLEHEHAAALVREGDPVAVGRDRPRRRW